MKRWIWRALVFLLIGAAINVAVAWSLALSNIRPSETLWLQDEAAARKGWPVEVPPSWGLPNVWCEWTCVGHTDLTVVSGARGIYSTGSGSHGYGGGEHLCIEQAGWPLRTAQSTRYGSFEGSSGGQGAGTRYGFVSLRIGVVREESYPAGPGRTGANVVAYLPISPLWTGLFINSVVYGLAASLLIGIGASVRYVRRRRALCGHCAYPTGTSPICTECGKPVKPRTAAAA